MNSYLYQRPTKTYDEACTEDSTIEMGLSLMGYDQATIDSLRDFFNDWVVCNEKNFKRYYFNYARPLVEKYNTQLRLETVDKNLNPFFDNYSERYIEYGGQDTRTPAGKTESLTPAEITHTISPAEMKDTKTYADYESELTAGIKNTRSGSIQTQESGSSYDETVSDNDNKNLAKVNPMSSSAATIGSGQAGSHEINGLDWTTSSQQGQTTQKGYQKTTHNASGHPTTEESFNNVEDARTGKDTNKVTYKNDEVVKKEKLNNGSDKLTVQTAGENKLTYDNDEVSEYGKTVKDRVKGRSNLTPQKALTEAMTYLRDISPAFVWLTEELEPAFLGVYDD